MGRGACAWQKNRPDGVTDLRDVGDGYNENGRVCAAIITFNCGAAVTEVAFSVIDQSDHILIVDNGSDPDTVSRIRTLHADHERLVTVILNERNRGIAGALNQAAKYATENDFEWLLTLDHDSHASPGMVQAMLRAYESFPMRSSVAIIAPNSTDTISGNPIPVLMSRRDREAYARANRRPLTQVVRFVHTSGNLVDVGVFREGFWFREDYFIDCVDFEFCLKLRKVGRKIIVAPEATMIHTIGSAGRGRILGRDVTYSAHSSRRMYYMVRNAITLLKESRSLEFAKWYFFDITVQTAKSVLFEPSRVSRLAAIGTGVVDGLLGRLGERG